MAETENQNEPTLPCKRKHDDDPVTEKKEDVEKHSNKSQTIEPLAADNSSLITQKKIADNKQALEPCENNQNDTVREEGGEDGDYEDEENGEELLVDTKGKGIMIEKDMDDGDDDSSDDDDGSELDSDDDDEDEDPLAEVDLDNILPSKTRRRVVQPGVYIANDNLANDDDDSDDSDA